MSLVANPLATKATIPSANIRKQLPKQIAFGIVSTFGSLACVYYW